MIFEHRDGNSAASRKTIPGMGSVSVDGGTFEVDPELVDVEALKEEGHTPQGESEPVETEPETEEQEEGDLTQYTEEDLVTASYDQLRSLATQFEDIDGRWGKDKLEEALIIKRRGQES